MKWILLLVLIPAVSAILDPCGNCSLPADFTWGDDFHCESQSDDSYTPTFIRYPLGTECYLQMMDCPRYETITVHSEGIFCTRTEPPQQALQCINGKFVLNGKSTEAFPIDRIRCNQNAVGYQFSPPVNCDDCLLPEILSETDTEFCGSVGSAGIQMTKTNNVAYCALILSGCDSYDVAVGYDGTGMCRSEENIVGVCVNGRFKLDGREIYKARCGAKNNTATNCTADRWYYNSVSKSHFKLGYNKTYEEAKAACEADGAKLASIHSQQENDFIVELAYMLNEQASVGVGFYVWIGVESDGGSGFRNMDGTPMDYSYWDKSNPSGDGPCVRMYTGYNDVEEGVPGNWNDLSCSHVSQAYVCRKSKATECPKDIAQSFAYEDTPGWIDGNLQFEYHIDESAGRLVVDFICTSPIPNREVHISSGDRVVWYNYRCTPYHKTATYVCGFDGKWLRTFYVDYVPSLGICGVDLNSTCTS